MFNALHCVPGFIEQGDINVKLFGSLKGKDEMELGPALPLDKRPGCHQCDERQWQDSMNALLYCTKSGPDVGM
jgi:hypothetical protein